MISAAVKNSLKKEAEIYLVKNIIAQIGKGLDDSMMALLMGKLEMFKEEYLTLWKNAQFAIKTGDYDAYLKNCLGFLSLLGYMKTNISKEEIEVNGIEDFEKALRASRLELQKNREEAIQMFGPDG